MMRVGVANNRHPAEIVQMTQAEFDVMPEGDSVQTLKVFDDFEHPHLAVPLDECFDRCQTLPLKRGP